MLQSVLQRVTKIIELEGKNVTRFSKLINVPQTTLNNYIKGSRKLSFELISIILSTFPDISAEWLMRGEGDMYKSQDGNKNSEIIRLKTENDCLRKEVEDLKEILHHHADTNNKEQKGKVAAS